MKRLRSVGIALVAVALSAALVFAARPLPDAATGGLERATDASGQVVPVRPAAAPVTQSGNLEPSGDDGDATASENEDAPKDRPDNHGAAVSSAAQSGPPEGQESEFRNHGAWVSSVARQNGGADKGNKPASPGKSAGKGRPGG